MPLFINGAISEAPLTPGQLILSLQGPGLSCVCLLPLPWGMIERRMERYDMKGSKQECTTGKHVA